MVKRLMLLLSSLVFLSFEARAECYQKYDYNSGNSYTVCRNNDGSTDTRGYNYNTGSSWRQHNGSDNTYRGYDSQGNYYRGDNNTGSYYNYGTGKTCYGKGYGRNCSD